MRFIGNFLSGFTAHFRGIGFVLKNPSYLPLCLIPMLLTLILFSLGVVWFTGHVADVANWLWSFNEANASWYMEVLHFIYKYLIRFILYVLLLGIMYFLFMVVANVVAVPFYEIIVSRIRKRPEYASVVGRDAEVSILKSIWEEAKKAVVVIAIPLLFLFVPVIGGFIAAAMSMTLLAWELLDVALVRDKPLLKERWGYFKTHKAKLFGFGSLLLVPFVGLVFFPFAIVGATLLYMGEMAGNAGPAKESAPPTPPRQ